MVSLKKIMILSVKKGPHGLKLKALAMTGHDEKDTTGEFSQ